MLRAVALVQQPTDGRRTGIERRVGLRVDDERGVAERAVRCRELGEQRSVAAISS
jgi:hypothetical protein